MYSYTVNSRQSPPLNSQPADNNGMDRRERASAPVVMMIIEPLRWSPPTARHQELVGASPFHNITGHYIAPTQVVLSSPSQYRAYSRYSPVLFFSFQAQAPRLIPSIHRTHARFAWNTPSDRCRPPGWLRILLATAVCITRPRRIPTPSIIPPPRHATRPTDSAAVSEASSSAHPSCLRLCKGGF